MAERISFCLVFILPIDHNHAIIGCLHVNVPIHEVNFFENVLSARSDWNWLLAIYGRRTDVDVGGVISLLGFASDDDGGATRTGDGANTLRDGNERDGFGNVLW